MFANFREQVANISAYINRWCLNPSDELNGMLVIDTAWDHIEYLGYNFQPSINFHCREATSHSVADVVMSSVLEPKCEETKCILQCILVAKSNRTEKA